MHEVHVKMTKIIAVIIVLAAIFIMVNGIAILKGSFYWRSSYFVMQWDYIKTKIEFIKYNYGGIAGWLAFQKYKNSANPGGFENAKSIPVLLYHGVISDPDWQPDEVNVRLSDFKEQMFALKKAGYSTVKLEDYLAFIKGEKELPKKSFIITFDDGRKDSYYPVDPILRALDYTAVMYVITNRSFSKDSEKETFHLTGVELRKMLDSGRWRIDSHGRDDHDPITIDPKGKTGHFLTNKMWIEKEKRFETQEEYKLRIYRDLLNSKKDIERNLGEAVLSFAFPFGDFGKTTSNFPESRGEVIDEVRKVYSISLCQTASGDFPANYQENSFLAKRIGIDSLLSARDLVDIFEKNYDKAIPYTDDFSRNNGWTLGWGALDLGNNAMVLKNSQTDEGGLAFLNGSYLWEDYFLSSKIKLSNAGKVSVAARYHDGNNYVSCEFADNSVALSQKINKEFTSELVVPADVNLSARRDVQVGIWIREYEMDCYMDGKKIVSGPINENLRKGGISFKIWNPVERGSALIVKDLEITSAPPPGFIQ